MFWRHLNEIKIQIKEVYLCLFISGTRNGVTNWLHEGIGSGNFLLPQTTGFEIFIYFIFIFIYLF